MSGSAATTMSFEGIWDKAENGTHISWFLGCRNMIRLLYEPLTKSRVVSEKVEDREGCVYNELLLPDSVVLCIIFPDLSALLNPG